MSQVLNIVNDNDVIIGEQSREEIHRSGLLHREVHVYFITPKREIIFQQRALDKDTFPGLLDATVGGHVEIGQSYKETALKESEEETGIKINPEDLVLINKIKKSSLDKATGKINNVFNTRYLYLYKGGIKDLRLEEGKAIGFELWPLDSLPSLGETEKARFIPYILEFSINELREFVDNNKIG
jgi:8-oxo-dGTP pyrophosphatase MutT (NUDIX family)